MGVLASAPFLIFAMRPLPASPGGWSRCSMSWPDTSRDYRLRRKRPTKPSSPSELGKIPSHSDGEDTMTLAPAIGNPLLPPGRQSKTPAGTWGFLLCYYRHQLS
ncbi:hypothetical protein GGD66_006606 [Bradyrhizobium sp. CIR48]|nr:hypothetical protein [Bradyrhizobium sp. CIR48]